MPKRQVLGLKNLFSLRAESLKVESLSSKEDLMPARHMLKTASALAIGLSVILLVQQPDAQTKPTNAKLCLNCHNPESGNIRGNFDNVAFKSQSIQVKIDEATEIVKFDPETIKVKVKGKEEPAEALRDIKKGHETRIAYTEKDGIKFATLVVAKPPISVPTEKLISTEEVMKLVAMGQEKGKYVLVDSRPAPRFEEGAIPTAINIPDAAMPAQAEKLPPNKDILLIFYCGGIT